MGNSGFRKIFLPPSYVETKYDSIYEIDVLTLDKEVKSLNEFKNKMCLIVNIASDNQEAKQQLKELQDIKEQYKDQLEILAFPCNQFNSENNDFDQIKKKNQDFKTIHILQKLEINGKYTHPLYRFLKRNSDLYDYKLLGGKDIQEDFSKFLTDRQGKVTSFYRKNVEFKSIKNDIESIINPVQDTTQQVQNDQK